MSKHQSPRPASTRASLTPFKMEGLKKVPSALFKLRVKNHLPVKWSSCPGFPSCPCQSDVKNLFLFHQFHFLNEENSKNIQLRETTMNPHLVLLPCLSFLLGLGWQFTGGPGHTKASAVPTEVKLASVSRTFQSAAEVIKPRSPDLLELMIYHVTLQTC